MPRVLCGDFNTAQAESTNGEVGTWADHHPRHREHWDQVELGVLLLGLAEHDLSDVFRALHGYERRDMSWVIRVGVARRFDHVFASSRLGATESGRR